MSLVDAIAMAGVDDPQVLGAFHRVDRARFLSEHEVDLADEDIGLSMVRGHMSPQPSILGRILELADLVPGARVLEIGSGTGYLTALLRELGAEVFPVECERRLAKRALQLTGVEVRIGDGHDGWPDRAPFDCVIATAAVAEVPAVWLAQLAPAGRIVCPLGRTYQRLTVTTLVDEPRADLSVDFETLSRM